MMNRKILIDVLKGSVEVTRTPIWLMRQAGRYLPEYRAVRANFSHFLDFCFTPHAAAKVTLQPLERFDLDGAIIFSDILVIPHALGRSVRFVQNEGPLLESLLPTDIDKLNLDTTDLKKVFDAIRLVKTSLKQHTALIGFAGSPWTIACYMIQGKGNKVFEKAIEFMRIYPSEFAKLIDKLIDSTVWYLSGQIDAGCDVVKLFDSWAGLLQGNEFRKYIIEANRKIISRLKARYPQIPIIAFPRNAGQMYKEFASSTDADCVSVDQDFDMASLKTLSKKICLSGNFDNVLLATSKKHIKQEVDSILRKMVGHPYIFNLGHGVLPHTPIENIEELINSVRNFE